MDLARTILPCPRYKGAEHAEEVNETGGEGGEVDLFSRCSPLLGSNADTLP